MEKGEGTRGNRREVKVREETAGGDFALSLRCLTSKTDKRGVRGDSCEMI